MKIQTIEALAKRETRRKNRARVAEIERKHVFRLYTAAWNVLYEIKRIFEKPDLDSSGKQFGVIEKKVKQFAVDDEQGYRAWQAEIRAERNRQRREAYREKRKVEKHGQKE